MSQMIKISFEWFTVHESQSTLKKKKKLDIGAIFSALYFIILPHF